MFASCTFEKSFSHKSEIREFPNLTNSEISHLLAVSLPEEMGIGQCKSDLDNHEGTAETPPESCLKREHGQHYKFQEAPLFWQEKRLVAVNVHFIHGCVPGRI